LKNCLHGWLGGWICNLRSQFSVKCLWHLSHDSYNVSVQSAPAMSPAIDMNVSMVTADYPDWGWLANFFAIWDWKNCWRGQELNRQSHVLVISQVPMIFQPCVMFVTWMMSGSLATPILATISKPPTNWSPVTCLLR